MDHYIEAFQARTDAKLRYAKVHLDELAALTSHGGDDFDRAHQESFLFHLHGTRDAFLIELNHYYSLGLSIKDISIGNLRIALKRRGINSPELSELYELQQDDDSWYSQIKDMRDSSVHNQGVPRAFYMGGEDDGMVKLKNPRTGVLTNDHFIDVFQEWIEQMRVLIEKLRASADSFMGTNNTLQDSPENGRS